MIESIIGIGLLFLLFGKKIGKVSEKLADKRTQTEPSDLFKVLRRRLSLKSSIIALAHASVESRDPKTNKLETKGLNFWNFGKPGWWNSESQLISGRVIPTVLNKRADNVGKTLGFDSIEDSVDAFIEVMRRGRPTYHGELVKSEPDIDRVFNSLCPGPRGLTGSNYATACNIDYVDNILRWLDYYASHDI